MGFLDRLRGRRRAPRYVTTVAPVLASDEPVERWRARYQAAGLRFVGITQNAQGCFYQTLAGDDPEAAKRYLRAEPVERELYYVVVETPDGNWGTDVNGLFLEKLRPWQLDVGSAECSGTIASLIDGYESIGNAAKGLCDNWVAGIECGRCGVEWIDGIRYRDVTLVRCPGCGAGNRVDARNYTVTHVRPAEP